MLTWEWIVTNAHVDELLLLQVRESREALAHQRLAAKLLALRTQQLENKLSRLSDDFVTPTGDVGHVREVNGADILSQLSVDCSTPNDAGIQLEGPFTEDKLSPVSDVVTPANTSCMNESIEATFDDCHKFRELQSGISSDSAADVASSQLTNSDDVDLAGPRDESTPYKKSAIPEPQSTSVD